MTLVPLCVLAKTVQLVISPSATVGSTYQSPAGHGARRPFRQLTGRPRNLVITAGAVILLLIHTGDFEEIPA